MLQLDSPLWRFSLRVYARPGVAAECLDLQRLLALNVNILLFSCWMAACRRVGLAATDIELIERAIAGWHALAVLPLRAVRDDLKGAVEMCYPEVERLREEVLASELRAEQIEQALIFAQAALLPTQHRADTLRELVVGNIDLVCRLAPHRAAFKEDVLVAKLIDASVDEGTKTKGKS